MILFKDKLSVGMPRKFCYIPYSCVCVCVCVYLSVSLCVCDSKCLSVASP